MGEIISYHATTKANAINIKKDGFAPSKKTIRNRGIINLKNIKNKTCKFHWLGDGIDFWDDKSNSFNWAKYAVEPRKSPDGKAVVKVPIIFNEDYIFDLQNKGNLKIIETIIEVFLTENGEEINDFLNYDPKIKNQCIGIACDIYYKKNKDKIDLFKGLFNIPMKSKLGIPYIQTQICVKNEKIIQLEKAEILELESLR